MPTYRYVCCVLDCNSIIIYLFIYFLSEVQNFVQLIEHFDEKGTCTSWRSVKHRTFSQHSPVSRTRWKNCVLQYFGELDSGIHKSAYTHAHAVLHGMEYD